MLQQATGLLIQAVPTFLAVVFLHWYLKKTLFQPIERSLEERRQATEGARKSAAAALEAAERKVAEYDARLRDARTEIYKDQEAWRKALIDDQNASVAAARAENAGLIASAKASVAAEAESARARLEGEAGVLAGQIVASVGRRGGYPVAGSVN